MDKHWHLRVLKWMGWSKKNKAVTKLLTKNYINKGKYSISQLYSKNQERI